jgi:hypothetical protein
MTEQGQLTDVDDSEDSEGDDGPDVDARIEEIANETDTSPREVRDNYQNMREYGVRVDEALRATARTFGASTKNSERSTDAVPVDDAEDWVTVEVRVAGAWQPDAPAVAQVAHLADESGLMKAVAWDKSDLPELEVGASYRITDAVVDTEDGGRPFLSLNSSTTVTEMDDDVETPEGL